MGGLAEAQDGKFGDVLLADALTSYSKVLAEIYINYCMFFSSSKSSTGKPDRMCGGRLIVPLLIAIPYAIRFRQCLIEFFRVRRGGHRNDGWGGQHLANALKYSTAFPVIIFSNLERNYSQETTHGLSEITVSRLWYVNLHRLLSQLVLTDIGPSFASSTPHTPSTGTSPKIGT